MNKLTIAAVLAATLGFVGCEVEQTEEGALPDVDVDATAGQVPKYDVDVTQTQEGEVPDVDVDVEGGKLPEYEVHGPDVTIGTQEKTITVPDIDIELPEDTDTDAEDEPKD